MPDYRLVFEQDDNGTVLVTSPDLPLASFGANISEARARAHDAALVLLQSMIDAREELPVGIAGKHSGDVLVLPAGIQLKVALYTALRASGGTRADLQRRLGWQRESVDRLFRLRHRSKLEQLTEALAALDKGVAITIFDRSELQDAA